MDEFFELFLGPHFLLDLKKALNRRKAIFQAMDLGVIIMGRISGLIFMGFCLTEFCIGGLGTFLPIDILRILKR